MGDSLVANNELISNGQSLNVYRGPYAPSGMIEEYSKVSTICENDNIDPEDLDLLNHMFLVNSLTVFNDSSDESNNCSHVGKLVVPASWSSIEEVSDSIVFKSPSLMANDLSLLEDWLTQTSENGITGYGYVGNEIVDLTTVSDSDTEEETSGRKRRRRSTRLTPGENKRIRRG